MRVSIYIVMDDLSRYCTAIPLKNKVRSEVATAYMKFIEQLETMTKQSQPGQSKLGRRILE
jgi:hypothetical protein